MPKQLDCSYPRLRNGGGVSIPAPKENPPKRAFQIADEAAQPLRTEAISTFTPGPMVELMAIRLI